MSGSAVPRRPRIGVTLGDPRGIGPEIAQRALSDPALTTLADFVLIGPRGLPHTPHPLVSIGEWAPLEAEGPPEGLGNAPPLVSVGGRTASEEPALAGRLAGLAIERAAGMALQGEIDALVTAPIDKAALHAGGWHFPGHTEMLQALTRASDVAMMMAAERARLGTHPLRVVLATTHLPLRDVPSALTAELLVRQATLTGAALATWWGITAPRLALCAFNPHASDGGLFGDEEERIYAPALERMRHDGLLATGPVPADTVFARALAGEFDAVIAPYHDVGMAPFKTVSFGTGVNVTLGLPFPRTSPDHGTALDIAGRGIADASSMIEAIRLAIRLADRFDTPDGAR